MYAKFLKIKIFAPGRGLEPWIRPDLNLIFSVAKPKAHAC